MCSSFCPLFCSLVGLFLIDCKELYTLRKSVFIISFHAVALQSLSHVQLLVTPWTAALQASLSFTISWSLLKLISIESVMPSNHLILCCCPLLLSSIFPSIRVFSNESALCIRWPKHWSFSFSISPSNAYSGLISFKIDWFDLHSVQGTLKSFLQHHNSKALSAQPSLLSSSHIYTFHVVICFLFSLFLFFKFRVILV